MNIQDLIGRYFWLLIIVITLINVPILQAKVKDEIEKYPSRADGYHKIIIGLASLIIIPCCAMGIGAIFGNVDFIRDILHHSSNFFTNLFYATVLVEAICLFIWVWFLNGAVFLAEHSNLFQLPSDIRIMKLISAAFLGWSIYYTFFPR